MQIAELNTAVAQRTPQADKGICVHYSTTVEQHFNWYRA